MQSVLRVEPDAVHLHFVFPDDPPLSDPALLNAYDGLLSASERARHGRVLTPRLQHQALVARALLRTTLSRYRPQVAPASWRFATGPHGRPELADSQFPGGFNLSHTDGLIVCAVAAIFELGVDLECRSRRAATEAIAGRFFTPTEARAVQTGPSRRFFDLWTLKEAFVKARGDGLSLPLRHFSFEISRPDGPKNPQEPNQNIQVAFSSALQDDPTAWRFFLMDPTPAYSAAVAVRSDARLKIRAMRVIPLRGAEPMPMSLVAQSARCWV